MAGATRILAGALLLTAGLSTTACAPSSSPVPPTDASTSVPTSAPAPSATPTPTPSPSGAAGAFPDCQTLIPLSVVQAQPRWAPFEFISQAVDAHEAPNLPGPLAVRTAQAATHRQDCGWGAPNSDSGVGVDMFRIDEASAKALVDELTAAPDEYRAFTIDDSPAFSTEAPWGISDGLVVYVFQGDAWLVMGGRGYDQAVATAVLTSALETLRAE